MKKVIIDLVIAVEVLAITTFTSYGIFNGISTAITAASASGVH